MIADNPNDLQVLLDSSKNPPSIKQINKEVQDQERLKAILDQAYNYGVKKGMESKVREINEVIDQQSRNLDAIYNFSPLLIYGKVVPPVITKASNLVQSDLSTKMKSTGEVYKIEAQAYFSTLPPNWRTYLNFPIENYSVDITETPTKKMMPKGSIEEKKWEEVTKKGFFEGENQAEKILTYSMNKLNRDYIGMIRFHEFVLSGKISMPIISQRSIAISSTSSAMAIDQKMLNITSLPSFNGNYLTWKNWITPATYGISDQKITINNPVY